MTSSAIGPMVMPTINSIRPMPRVRSLAAQPSAGACAQVPAARLQLFELMRARTTWLLHSLVCGRGQQMVSQVSPVVSSWPMTTWAPGWSPAACSNQDDRMSGGVVAVAVQSASDR